MSAGSTHRITITDRQRFQKLRYDILLWTPMWLLAGITSWYGRSSRAEKYGSTFALSGLRACLALWVMLEHAAFTVVPASGAFIVLSGAALSTSRIAQPGVTKTPFNTLQSYFEFIFLRMARVLPLYWVWFGCLHPYDSDPSKYSQGRSTFDDMVLFYLRIPRNLINAFQNQTFKMLLLTPNLNAMWFLQTITIMYIFYPILESLALGCCSKQPALPSHFHLAFFMWCIAKVVLVVPASLLAEGLLAQGMGSGYWLVYTNPVLRVPDFMLGILLPHLANPDGKGWIQWAPLVADILLVSLGFVLIFAPPDGVALRLVELNIEAPLTAFAIWGFCYGPSPSPLGRFLSMPLLVKIGEWSYGVYVMNSTVLYQYHLLPHWLTKFTDWTAEYRFLPFLIILVFGMSWSVFVLVETPCSNLARWAVAKEQQATDTKMKQCPDGGLSKPGETMAVS